MIFFVLGLLVLSQPILADWTKQARSVQGTVLGMTLPVPQALIHVTMFIGAMTFMYVSQGRRRRRIPCTVPRSAR